MSINPPPKRSRNDRIMMYSMCGAIICGTIAGIAASAMMTQNRWIGFCIGYAVGGTVGWLIGLGAANAGVARSKEDRNDT